MNIRAVTVAFVVPNDGQMIKRVVVKADTTVSVEGLDPASRWATFDNRDMLRVLRAVEAAWEGDAERMDRGDLDLLHDVVRECESRRISVAHHLRGGTPESLVERNEAQRGR